MTLILTSNSSTVISRWTKHMPSLPQQLRLTFISTASEVSSGDLQWLYDDRLALVDAGFQVTDYSISDKNSQEVGEMLQNTDVVFMAGGNSFYLLQKIQASGFDTEIIRFLENGGIYVGSSAGSVVAGPDISEISVLDDPTLAPALESNQGLALIDVTIFPHWGKEKFKDRYQKMFEMSYTPSGKRILLTDEQYLLCRNNTISIESI